MMLETEEERNKITTIQLTQQTVDKLVEAKIHPRETYEDVIKRLLEES